jgi:4-amino-4-deoxy-L-arabinose transferase-like glycosyltransferase
MQPLPLSPSRLPRRWVLAALFGLAVLLRLGLLVARRGQVELWEYDTLATSIASGQGYVISRFGHLALAFGDGNLYSFLTGVVYTLVGHQPIVMAVVQSLLAACLAPLIYAIGERTVGRRAALLGAVLAAGHPGLLAYSLKLHPLGTDAMLLALFVYWAMQPVWTARDGLITGLVLGLNLMTRPTFFVACVVGLGARWLSRRRRQTVLSVGIVLLGLAIAGPWMARNTVFLGRPVLISTSLEDVWKGNNPNANGSSLVTAEQDIFDIAPPELRARLLAADELQLNDIFGQETLDFVRQHPQQFVGLVVRKFGYFWWMSPQAGLLYPRAFLAVYQVYAAAVLGLAAVGAVVITRRGTGEERTLLSLLAAISLTVAAIHALAYVEGRHRWGVEPLLLLLSARGVLAIGSALDQVARGGQVPWLRRMSER